MRYVKKPGRLANSKEADSGVIVHVVDSDKSVFDGYTPALCGAKPAGRRAGWTDYEYMNLKIPEVTCPRCLKKLALHHAAATPEEGVSS
ncbi:TPA: hypothetical protein ACGW3M_000986 [Pseudomonas aeruginosa]|uniref:hypothetical protein n=1 Tax=Pseudomonas aeruginosa TaxID=287 RepID=UPI0027FA48B6|nr:hypothetical protein [Pseudomonas aeruginosa]EKY4113674.1 hypothetical protein [Pseudomonas aeruginosa]ELJ2276196.1 hypothetical protein [Pseudomonas aeruginosa]MBX6653728.1 hypothetical protein [Pseudomonas aeruginosa]MCS8413379.1 hypothetical protein [Pseudomonas aeruginosa]